MSDSSSRLPRGVTISQLTPEAMMRLDADTLALAGLTRWRLVGWRRARVTFTPTRPRNDGARYVGAMTAEGRPLAVYRLYRHLTGSAPAKPLGDTS